MVSYSGDVQPTCEGCHTLTNGNYAANHHGLNDNVYNAGTNPNGRSINFPGCLTTDCSSGGGMGIYSTNSYGYKMINAWVSEGRNSAN
jgi:hypothetical protein